MNRLKRIIWLVGVFVFVISGIGLAQEDEEGCKDHPMFTRIPNFYIENCKEKDFARADFIDEKGKDITVEGKYYWAEYDIKEGYKAPSELQILRNF